MGSTNRRPDREMVEEMRRYARGVGFDEQALPELDSEALDFRAASESFAPIRKLKRADLETLRMVDDLRRGISRLRNRVIGRVFHELGLIEQWGSGIQRMTSACRAAGLAPPVLEEIGTRFRVTLHTGRSGPPAVDPTDQAILDALASDTGLSTQAIASAIDLTPRATRTRLVKLVGRGLVREIGTSAQDPKRRYFRARQGP